MKCDCGSITFLKFGPYVDDPTDLRNVSTDGRSFVDHGLRWIYTCSKCGDQLRVYQGSKMGVTKFRDALDKYIANGPGIPPQ